MDLHSIVSGAIGSVNPFIQVEYHQSTGFTTLPNLTRVPAYSDPVLYMAQVQELSFKSLQHVQGMGLQGIFRSIYIAGIVKGVDRASSQGGDFFRIVDNINSGDWLVVDVPEQWPDWCHIIVVKQVPVGTPA